MTLDVSGSGVGGRNQQFVLEGVVRARERFGAIADVVVMSAGTDGADGPTDAAGAVIATSALDSDSCAVAREHAARFDAYPFLDRAGALIRTGPTGTNVRDLRVFLARATVA